MTTNARNRATGGTSPHSKRSAIGGWYGRRPARWRHRHVPPPAGGVPRSGPSTRDDAGIETTRVDRWLWAVRLYKTRTDATDACRGGHVRVNGTPAKAATPVRAGDTVEATAHGRDRVLEVVQVIDKRVGAAVAAAALIDHSPPPPPRDALEPPAFARDRGTGRPTKRDRRALDRFRTG